MSFEVRPDAVKSFAGDMDTLSSAAYVAEGYAAHTSPKASGGSAFVRLLNSTADVQPQVAALFQHLRSLASTSADELVAAARYYETTDTSAAQAADATYSRVASAPTNGPR